ncbi:TPA: hypothetical protein N0X68_004342 [Enterobacter roggenkampii]|nr:hypothetical protein [Enterobacter roggenkampii]
MHVQLKQVLIHHFGRQGVTFLRKKLIQILACFPICSKSGDGHGNVSKCDNPVADVIIFGGTAPDNYWDEHSQGHHCSGTECPINSTYHCILAIT